MLRSLIFLLLLIPALCFAQNAYDDQVRATERLIDNERFPAARAQAEALIQSGKESQQPEIEARGHYLLGRARLEDPAADARDRVDGIRSLQLAAAGFRSAQKSATVDSIMTTLREITGNAELPEIELPTVRALGGDRPSSISKKQIDESALSAIVSLQSREIEQLTDSQMRQLILLERQDRRLDQLSFRSMEDSIMLLQQQSQIDQRDAELDRARQRRNLLVAIALAVLALLGALYSRYRSSQRYQAKLQVQNEIIENERRRSDDLLLNILPASVALELKDKGRATARSFDSASILFADFKGFSRLASTMQPADLVQLLDQAFRAFDDIVDKHGLEKIKTIGDSYMCAAGLPLPVEDHARRAVLAGMEMQAYLSTNPNFDARIGIHSGPVVAGVVGRNKFAYDVWGDTVNQAARLEQAGEVGLVSVSGNTRLLIGEGFLCEQRGTFEAKNMGQMDRFVVISGPSD